MLTNMETIQRLKRDVLKGAEELGRAQVRFLVDSYYMIQEERIRSAGQVRELSNSGEPHELLVWFLRQHDTLEQQIKRVLEYYAKSTPLGRWAMSQKGIGPVITAGLLAHIDISKAPTAGHIWSYAGLDPRVIWPSREQARAWIKENGVNVEKAAMHFRRNPDTLLRMATTDRNGKQVKLTADSLARALCKRPWNARLKVLCWKIGESFIKLYKKDDAFYGVKLRQRLEYERAQNKAGAYAEQAERLLREKNYGKNTEAYKHMSEGRLSPAHILARAKRWTVKLFLAHYHEMAYILELGQKPPMPYPIAHMGHVHRIAPPVHDLEKIIGDD